MIIRSSHPQNRFEADNAYYHALGNRVRGACRERDFVLALKQFPRNSCAQLRPYLDDDLPIFTFRSIRLIWRDPFARRIPWTCPSWQREQRRRSDKDQGESRNESKK